MLLLSVCSRERADGALESALNSVQVYEVRFWKPFKIETVIGKVQLIESQKILFIIVFAVVVDRD
jgi:hypothetical protein